MIRAGLAIVLALCACAGSKPAPTSSPSRAGTVSSTPAQAVVPSEGPAASASSEDAAPAGTSATDDDETVLMSKRWKYAAYFNAMKRKVAASWDPASVWKRLPDPMRLGLGTATRETMVEVSLAADGTLVKLAILKSSGVTELDAEAIRAFQISSPFGPYPTGLGASPFKFSFFFEVGGTSTLGVGP